MKPLSQVLFAVLAVTAPLAAQPPAPPPPQIQIRMGINVSGSRTIQMNGDHRRITVNEKDESITIEDTAGKNITIRRTRTLDGQKKSEEFKAPDLETLKKNHPDAAELYQKQTEAAKNLQIQIPPPRPLNPGDPFGMPRTNRSLRGQGTRQITSTSKGKTVEIKDRYGEEIVITLTDRRSGESKPRKIEADDLADLEAKDAEAAGHYKRLTAEN